MKESTGGKAINARMNYSNDTKCSVNINENWPNKIGREAGVPLLLAKKNWPQKLAGDFFF